MLSQTLPTILLIGAFADLWRHGKDTETWRKFESSIAELTIADAAAKAAGLLRQYHVLFSAMESRAYKYRLMLFLMSILLLGYVMHAVMELTRARAWLLDANETLEHHVERRTAELQSANTHLEKEITERLDAEKKVRRMALEDSLTGLPNRKEFHRRLKAATAATVETEVQLDYLKKHDCDEVQGFYYSRALLPGRFPSFVRSFGMPKGSKKRPANQRKRRVA